MKEMEERQYDTRQLDKMRARQRQASGEPRLHHSSGLPESYVLLAWHARAGDRVEAHQVIATIATDSFTLEFEAFEPGILREQCFAPGDSIPDGAVLARIDVSTEDSSR